MRPGLTPVAGAWRKTARVALPARTCTVIAALCLAVLPIRGASGQATPAPEPSNAPPATTQDAAAPVADQDYAFHIQSTFVDQAHPGFTSPYRGPQSLDPVARADESWDVTIYAGLRPWNGAELWVNPELDQGFGLSDTLGLAAFPSGEAYKLGDAEPYLRIPRLFLRQTIDLGGTPKAIDADENVLGHHETDDKVVVTIGKFGVPDVFDTNDYAHDPRHDFLNWALIDIGTFDYAADAWGYSYGAAVEWYQAWWTLRFGGFALSRVPNSTQLDTSGGQFQLDAEAEARWSTFGRDTKLKMLGFLTRGRMTDFDNAVALAQSLGVPADNVLLRTYRSRAGVGLNLQQAITDQIGLFARAGYAEGGTQDYEFTDVDNSISFGFSFRGDSWGRKDDSIGVGFVRDDISRRFKNYLNDGGLGILIGDGKLPSSGPERAAEVYYDAGFAGHFTVTGDAQVFDNPAYNTQRGPVGVFAVRLHVQY
jgi:high affinity Mn2+ porin